MIPNEHPLDKARRLWKQMGQELPEKREPYDASSEIHQADLAPIDRPQNLSADFELAIKGFIEVNRPHRIRALIERIIHVRGLQVVRGIVASSPNEDIILQQAGDLL